MWLLKFAPPGVEALAALVASVIAVLIALLVSGIRSKGAIAARFIDIFDILFIKDREYQQEMCA